MAEEPFGELVNVSVVKDDIIGITEHLCAHLQRRKSFTWWTNQGDKHGEHHKDGGQQNLGEKAFATSTRVIEPL